MHSGLALNLSDVSSNSVLASDEAREIICEFLNSPQGECDLACSPAFTEKEYKKGVYILKCDKNPGQEESETFMYYP